MPGAILAEYRESVRRRGSTASTTASTPIVTSSGSTATPGEGVEKRRAPSAEKRVANGMPPQAMMFTPPST